MSSIPAKYEGLVYEFKVLTREEIEWAFGWLVGYSKATNEGLAKIRKLLDETLDETHAPPLEKQDGQA